MGVCVIIHAYLGLKCASFFDNMRNAYTQWIELLPFINVICKLKFGLPWKIRIHRDSVFTYQMI